MSKAEMRSHLKQLRLNLSDVQRNTLSGHICHRLEEVDWSGVRNLHCFEPITKLAEVDISDFIAFLQLQNPKIQIYTSRKIDGIWKIVSWDGHDPAKTIQFDAVIVPMLGFDSQLNRIGYGGGYYDKFLATQPQAKKIGVCFEFGKVQYIPTESHDIALDSIITETQVYVNQRFIRESLAQDSLPPRSTQ